VETDLFSRYSVIDVDAHLTEPPDVWTARMPASRHDEVPHLGHLSDDVLAKVLHDTAATLYRLP
jgi:hypothetical protein